MKLCWLSLDKQQKKMFLITPDQTEGVRFTVLSGHQRIPFAGGTRDKYRQTRHALDRLESRVLQVLLYTANTKDGAKKHNLV